MSTKYGKELSPAELENIIQGRMANAQHCNLGIAPNELRMNQKFAISLVKALANSPTLNQFMFCQSCEFVTVLYPWRIFHTCQKDCVFFSLIRTKIYHSKRLSSTIII
jgi:hypothetical protein